MASTAPAQREERIVFTAGSKIFPVRDVLDAVYFRGEIEAPWEEFLARIASAKKAEETNAEMDEPAIDAAAVEFRYQYDLITAEETERWLEARALNLSEFSEYFTRGHWAKTFRAKPEPRGFAFAQAPEDLRDLFVIDLTLNGALDVMANRLAWRVAAQRNDEVAEPAAEALEAEREGFRKRHGLELSDISAWLGAIGRDENWLEEQLRLEICFRREREKILTPEAAEREVGALRLPLTRFDVETVEFESRDAASEAVLCVRDDGMSLAEVADEGRYPYRRTEVVLEEIAEDLQQKFLSVTPGSLLDPIALEDGYQVSRVLGKAEPAPDEPRVRARIETRILERHFAELTSKHLRWEILPVVTE